MVDVCASSRLTDGETNVVSWSKFETNERRSQYFVPV